ncbi:MAG: hypothetical protein KDE08_01685 [Rhodobacteraceae bacterium]|nr:hypothetical protein [Paracoccaceae bacterium]
MVDRNLQRFYGRIGRIEKIHQAGGGFEANGTLGMSFYKSLKRPRRRRSFLAPVVLVMIAVVGIKATVHATIGAELYEERIAELRSGPVVDQVGAYVLQADPATLMLSAQIRKFIR